MLPAAAGVAGRSRAPRRDTESMQTLTEYEWRALNGKYNLSDGHAHHSLLPWLGNEAGASLLRVANEAERIPCSDAYKRFVTTFFACGGQNQVPATAQVALQYSASISIEIVANVLRRRAERLGRAFRLALLHPTFDNIPSILCRHGIALTRVPDDPAALVDAIASEEIDGVFLVCPNNPTGTELDRKHFEKVLTTCRTRELLLIIDFSFRWFSDYLGWSQYAMLAESRVEFLAIEDTGKAWAALELKIGMLVYSVSMQDEVMAVQNDMLLNVSPFTLLLLANLMACRGIVDALRDVVRDNRARLRDSLRNCAVHFSQASTLSVEWIRLPAGSNSVGLAEALARRDVFVLPGGPFFWANPAEGQQFIRVALLRPRDWFVSATERLAAAWPR